MSLYNLKREYEERRQALIDQLQKNPHLDPATQHQIYGAIKEIENFLKTIEYQISSEQERNMNVALSSERPSPVMERTKGAVFHVAHGTKKIFTHHIPSAARKVVDVPKSYFDKKREEARLRAEIEAEIRARKAQHGLHQATAAVQQQQLPARAEEHVVLEHPHQELEVVHEEPAPQEEHAEEPLPTWSDETVTKAPESRVINDHVKRPKPVSKPAKAKSHPSKHAQGKKGGQHKPHLKRDKYRR